MENFATILQSLLPTGGVWENLFLGNPLSLWFAALAAFVAFLVVFKVFQVLVLWRLKHLAERTKTDIDDILIRIVQSLRPPFYSFLAFYLAVRILALPGIVQRVIDIILIIWVVWQAAVAFQILLDYAFKKGISKEGDPGTKSALKLLNSIARATLWLIGGLFILSNLGVNVTSLVAGLGIGGIAVALAIQNILGDLFSSFAIYFDKPFVVGDFIKVGDFVGEVEKIGIKTTRLRALQGEEVVISNQELTNARVQNFKKMEERRVAFYLGVTYDTSSKKLENIPKIVKKAVESTKAARFNRTHFIKFDDSALIFEAVYYVTSPEYDLYMDTHQAINLKIKKAFEKEKIAMAYPTRTVYLEKTNE